MIRKTSFILLILLAVVGCRKTENAISNDTESRILSLSGQINNWNYGGDRYICFIYRDSQMFSRNCSVSKIDSQGNFKLENLASPPQSSFSLPVYPSETDYVTFTENTLTCTDSTMRMIPSQLEVGGLSPGSWVGFVYRSSYKTGESPKTGDFEVSYIYVTKDVSLSGTLKINVYTGSDSTEIHDIAHYDLHFVEGWNQEVKSYISQTINRDSNKTVYQHEYYFSNNEPSQGQWNYYGN